MPKGNVAGTEANSAEASPGRNATAYNEVGLHGQHVACR